MLTIPPIFDGETSYLGNRSMTAVHTVVMSACEGELPNRSIRKTATASTSFRLDWSVRMSSCFFIRSYSVKSALNLLFIRNFRRSYDKSDKNEVMCWLLKIIETYWGWRWPNSRTTAHYVDYKAATVLELIHYGSKTICRYLCTVLVIQFEQMLAFLFEIVSKSCQG